eukprot:2091688-Pyramimonas_sp.AAC.1
MTNLGLCEALLEEICHALIVDLRAGALVVARERCTLFQRQREACPFPHPRPPELEPHAGSAGSA